MNSGVGRQKKMRRWIANPACGFILSAVPPKKTAPAMSKFRFTAKYFYYRAFYFKGMEGMLFAVEPCRQESMQSGS